jgi:hypothetical protein
MKYQRSIFGCVGDKAANTTKPSLPVGMHIQLSGPGREPDLIYVCTERMLEGPADLVVEVISDDSVTREGARRVDLNVLEAVRHGDDQITT